MASDFWYIAGRGAKEANLYSEIAEGIYSYGVTRHRHGNYLSTDENHIAFGCINDIYVTMS